LTQPNPKTVLAYSSVSQMGVVATVLGMALAAGDRSALLQAAFYASHHVLAKGALFMAVGVVAASGPRAAGWTLVPATVLALGFGGLPPTGGYLAKLAVKAPLGDGIVGSLALVSAVGSAFLMTHFVRRLAAGAAEEASAEPPLGLALPWAAVAVASIAVPWALFSTTGAGTAGQALPPAALWSGLWPVGLGAALGLSLARWERLLPRVPEGDVAVLAERATLAASACGGPLERIETVFRDWPTAALSFLAVTLLLAGALALPR
jgi:formate hydrogenlyase subunit 3/multisubunit Na+/H+ antiporter MnhD subunit